MTNTQMAALCTPTYKISALVHWAQNRGMLFFLLWLISFLEQFLKPPRNLPPPIRPSTRRTLSEEDTTYRRGSLSDFSDYESSDEEAHRRVSASTSSSRPYSSSYGKDDVVGGEEETYGDAKHGLLDEEDPFADPFADQDDEGGGVGTPGVSESKLHW